MYKNKTFVGLIPARGGSVSIPKKNIYPLDGTPLIWYTVDAADKSKYLDGIYCTTDDDEIAAVAGANPKCGIIKRPPELATNTSKTIDCIIHALKELKSYGKEFDYFIILQPTSPLRTTKEIDDFIMHVVDHDLPACVSISPLPYLPVLMRHIKENDTGGNSLENVIEGTGTVRRQDARPTFYVDGSLNAWRTKDLLAPGGEKISLNDAPCGFVNDQLADVNTKDDLLFCEFLLQQRRNKDVLQRRSFANPRTNLRRLLERHTNSRQNVNGAQWRARSSLPRR